MKIKQTKKATLYVELMFTSNTRFDKKSNNDFSRGNQNEMSSGTPDIFFNRKAQEPRYKIIYLF